jgi:hypothetical protein
VEVCDRALGSVAETKIGREDIYFHFKGCGGYRPERRQNPYKCCFRLCLGVVGESCLVTGCARPSTRSPPLA